ncbi:ABC transporter substrate-binding protein [Dactylosporangium sp. CA-092794]|uniref:ABC transporter substrate-binding protein n=1 Tax=Dactylosporangium sp. CA-092794 TaxID=3239929 RepID=UPI003D90794D
MRVDRGHRLWLAGVAAASALVLAACGSSDDKTTGGGGGSTSSSDPIKITMITGTGPGTPGAEGIPGAKAAVSDVNDNGGVNGRKLELTVCDAKADANLAGACARTAVGDKDQVATVGNALYGYTDQQYAVQNQAKMPAIGVKMYGLAEHGSPMSFPVEAGGIGSVPAGVALLAAKGVKKVMFVSVNVPSSTNTDAFIRKYVMPTFPNSSYIKPVLVPTTQTDMQATSAEIIRSAPDGIQVGLPPAQAIAFVKTIRAQGYTGPLVIPSSVLTAQQIKDQIGAAAGNLIISGEFSHEGPGWEAFLAGMKKYQPDANVTEQGTNPWISVHMFADVAKTISGPITRESVLAAFQKLDHYDTKGLTPALDYTKPPTYEGYTRDFNPTVVELQYKDGVISNVPPVKFTNVFTGQALTS